MIHGFILVSVLCIKGVHQGQLVAGVPSNKINCRMGMEKVYQSRESCEKANEKQVETVEVDGSSYLKKLIVMPGSACVEINKIVGSTIDWKLE